MAESIQIDGLRELQLSLAKVDKDAGKVVRKALRVLGEPVRADAERLAGSEIENIGPVWNRMRLGQPAGTVYIVPKTKPSGGSKRPNLGALLMEKAMIPALDEHEAEIVAGVDLAIGGLLREAGL